MGGPQWDVVGGADKGGIVVREGVGLNSAQLDRLSTGALVEEVERSGDRLHYRLLKGDGPRDGWVSVRLKDKILLEPREAPTRPSKAAPPPVASAATGPVPPKAAESSPPPLPADFESRVAAMREKYPGCVDLQVPEDARGWSHQELDMFFESSGFVKPQGRPPPRAAPKLPKKENADGAIPNIPQFKTHEALKLQDELREAFAGKDFRERLTHLQDEYPQRKTRGHPHGPMYFEAFELVVMSVYGKVLPRWNLEGDWDGVNNMYAKMTTAMMHPKVKKQQEELNTLLGLPRDAVFRPSKKQEDMFVYCPAQNAPIPGYPLPLVMDSEGDNAHEFFVEDIATGELVVGPTAMPSNLWYRVVHRPQVAVRARPEVKSAMITTKNFGDRVRVQKEVDGKWLMLHEEELRKLSVAEAWLLRDGAEINLGELLERIP